jgi:hypothetical protein
VQPVVHHLNVSQAPGSARRAVPYRSYVLIVAAATDDAGAILVRVSLRGGPERIEHRFAFRAEQSDATAACEAALAELRAVVDELWLGPVTPAPAYGR